MIYILKFIKLAIYCLIMRLLWSIGYRLYNWAEDHRPGGGFHIENYYL